MLSLCAGETENCVALGTFAVNVRLSVAELVFSQLEESAKFFVFASALRYVF